VDPVFGGHLVEDKREPVSKADHILLEDRFVMANDQRKLGNLLFDCDLGEAKLIDFVAGEKGHPMQLSSAEFSGMLIDVIPSQ
jgi:hypothetical protein